MNRVPFGVLISTFAVGCIGVDSDLGSHHVVAEEELSILKTVSFNIQKLVFRAETISFY